MNRIAGIGFNTGDVAGDLDRLDRTLARFAAMGCEMAELTATGLDAVAAGRLIDDRVDAVRTVLSRHRLDLTLHAPIAINLMDEANRDLHVRAALASCELSAALGARQVVIHPGRVAPTVWERESDRLLALERDALAIVGDRAAELGVAIACENISPTRRVIAGEETSYALDPAALARQLSALGHPAVHACLDVSHAQQGAGLLGFDLLAAVATLSPHVSHIHYSDSTGVPATMDWKRDGELLFLGAGDMHAPPGCGAVDFAAIARALDVLPGTRIVIELKANFHPHAAEATLAAARDFAALVEGRNASAGG